ncbi:MAG: hypothetical protein ACXACY_27675 [Candidatus Hodarchaeales archaeon]
MKSWQKGAVIGGIWGIISIFGITLSAFNWAITRHSKSLVSLALNTKIVFAPAYITLRLLETDPIPDLLGIIFISLPILIGALIGSIIGLAIEKYRQRRPSK